MRWLLTSRQTVALQNRNWRTSMEVPHERRHDTYRRRAGAVGRAPACPRHHQRHAQRHDHPAEIQSPRAAGQGRHIRRSMTSANERLAAIEAAEVGSATPSSASSQGQSQQLLDIEAQAVEVLLEADRADILLEEVFEKLEGLGTSPAVLAIECFTTCAARAVSLMHEAADNIVSLVAEGVAA